MDSDWADGGQLKRNFHGLNNIKWGPRWYHCVVLF